jgi:hypothetical protein
MTKVPKTTRRRRTQAHRMGRTPLPLRKR